MDKKLQSKFSFSCSFNAFVLFLLRCMVFPVLWFSKLVWVLDSKAFFIFLFLIEDSDL